MKSKWKEVLCFFMVKLILVKCDYFSVVASAILRIDEPYRVAVTSHDMFGEELELKVGIQGETIAGEVIEVFQEIFLDPGSSKVLKFRFPNISFGTYELIAECNDFSKSVGLYINPQKVTLMIQFDKPIYKTTDVVNFRIFAINSRTKPYTMTPGYSKIWILDPRNNELKSWENVQLTMGIYEDKFVFTRLRPGIYEILAEVDETIVSKKFEIFKDSQSIYDLKLAVPERVSFRDGVLRIKISIHLRSKYALENLHTISGKLVLTCDERRIVKYQKIMNATHYEVYENIDFINDLGLEFMDDRRKYTLQAVFMDDVTNRNFTSTAAFTIEMSDFQIQIVHSPKYFKIGIPYSFTLLVTKSIDEYPVMSSIEPIYVVVKDDRDDILIDRDFQLDPNTGSVEIRTPEIPEDTLFLNIFAKYDKIQYSQQVNLSSTQRSESIAIDVLTPRPKMYEQVEFELTTTSKSTSFAVFQVFGKGLLKMSKLIPLDYGYANFSIIPKFSYTPKAHCIVYFITEDGDLISDSIVLNFDNQFPNFVHLQVDPTDSITPGSSFSLNVTSTLFSSVSLLAIDQRGISQRHKYDILKDFVFDNELIKYDRAAIENFYDFDIPFWFYPLSYQKTFFEVGAVILSNAVQDIPCKPDDTVESIYDKFVIDDDQILKASKYLDREKVEDVKQYHEGFLFKTVTIETPADDVGIKGEEFLIENLPDTSATWAFTAITLNQKYGLGMSEDPFLLESYKKFFIDFSVPVFVKVGEIFLIEILIGNLYDEDLTANVKVFNYHRGYEISRPWTYEWTEAENGYSQNVEIPPFNVHRLVIEVSAETFGSYNIQIAATSAKGVETKVETITIIPEGFLTRKTDTIFIATENCYSNLFRTLKLNLDEESIIDGTLSVHADVVGDIMGIPLSNLDAFFKEPIGNAEEILFVFSLNVLTLDYLLFTDQLTVPIKVKALHYLTQSYQKLIKYRNIDGSFSSFVENDSQGSVWLTANVLRQLQKAQRYIEINEEVFLEALCFIASKQEKCGKFQSDRENSVNDTQTDVAFTAFIGILFDENKKSYPQYISVLQKAVEYVELHYDKSNLYSLALVTHFMHEVDSPLKYQLLQSLLSHIQEISSNEVTWKDFNATSMDVEINSYCLMTLDHIPELYAEAFKIVQWLLIQQNSNGKFFSTQDTIVALEAISRFASRLSDTEENLEISLTPNGDEDYIEYASIAGPLALIKQIYMLPPTTRYLDVSAHGDGFAIIQLSCSYYVYSIQSSSAISLTTQFKDESCNDYLILTVSIELALGDVSDIVLVSIESPSGFIYDDFGSVLPDYVVNIEELNQGTLLHVYLKKFGSIIQFDLAFLRKFIIFNEASSNIEVFDFNNEAIKSTTFYKVPKDLPLCSNQTLSTSPPIYEFTTLEPLSTAFPRFRATSGAIETTEELTTESEDEEIETITDYEENVEDYGFDTEYPEYGEYTVPEDYEIEEIEDSPEMNELFPNDEFPNENFEELVPQEDSGEIEDLDLDTDDNFRIEDVPGVPDDGSDTVKDFDNEISEDNYITENFEADVTTEIIPATENAFDSNGVPDDDSITFEDDISYRDTATNFEGLNGIEEINDLERTVDSEIPEKSGSDEIFPEERIATDDVDNAEDISITDKLTVPEEETTTLELESEITTEEPIATTTTISPKEKFKKKFKPKALPKSFKKNQPKPSNQLPKIPKLPPKFKKFSKN